MSDIKVDNIISNTKKELDLYDEQVRNNLDEIKNIDNLQRDFYKLNNNINKCCDLVNKSVKNKSVNNKMISIQDDNKININKIIYNLDETKDEKIRLNKEILNKKEELLKRIKEEKENKKSE